jgi:hypothetical protein
MTLAELEQMAVQGNPTLTQAAANVEVARGRAVQSGLYPNPTVGYTGERIGAAGTAGDLQGLFINQTIVTAGKLRLNRGSLSWQKELSPSGKRSPIKRCGRLPCAPTIPARSGTTRSCHVKTMTVSHSRSGTRSTLPGDPLIGVI